MQTEYSLENFMNEEIYKKYKFDPRELRFNKESIQTQLAETLLKKRHKSFKIDKTNNISISNADIYLTLMYVYYCINEFKVENNSSNLPFEEYKTTEEYETMKVFKFKEKDFAKKYIPIYKITPDIKKIYSTINDWIFNKIDYKKDKGTFNKDKFQNLFDIFKEIKLEFMIAEDDDEMLNKEKHTAISTFVIRLFPNDKEKIYKAIDDFLNNHAEKFIKISKLNLKNFENMIPLVLIKTIISNDILYSDNQQQELHSGNTTREDITKEILKKLEIVNEINTNGDQNYNSTFETGLIQFKDTTLINLIKEITQLSKQNKLEIEDLQKTKIEMLKNYFLKELDNFGQNISNIVKKANTENEFLQLCFYKVKLIDFIFFINNNLDQDFHDSFKLLNLLVRLNINHYNGTKVLTMFDKKRVDIYIYISLGYIDKLKQELKKLIKESIANTLELSLMLSHLKYDVKNVLYKKLMLLPNMLSYTNLEEITKTISMKSLLDYKLETEHILSQKVEKVENFFNNEHEFYLYVHSIGNLVLLDKETNKELENQTPEKKVDTYKASKYRHISELGKKIEEQLNNSEYDKQEFKELILKRQEEMFDYYINSYNRLFNN
jgi:hypothetical protein